MLVVVVVVVEVKNDEKTKGIKAFLSNKNTSELFKYKID